MGVSIESNDYIKRADSLRKCDAKTKFFSIEPLIDSVDKLDYTGIDWVIVGGESGFGAREVKKEWVVDVQQKCERHDIQFFFKQWGKYSWAERIEGDPSTLTAYRAGKKAAGRTLYGQIWDQMPGEIGGAA